MRKGRPSNRTIYVRVVVDTDAVLQDRAGSASDTDTPVIIGYDTAQMIVTTTAGNVDAATGDITVDAAQGDLIRFYAKSGSNNFESAILIEDIVFGSDAQIVDDAALVALPGFAVAPASDAPLTLSDECDEPEFWFWQSRIVGDGTQQCHAVLALYDRDDRGRPRLAGLYQWDFPLTVTLTEPSASANEGVAS